MSTGSEPRSSGRDHGLEVLSIAAYAMLGGAAVAVVLRHDAIGASVIAKAVQGLGLALMIWARVTFRARSFHVAANPTAGGLVTTGPYRFVRHPVYAAALLVILPAVLSHPSAISFALGGLAVVGIAMRIVAEERLVTARYPEYASYARRTRRLVPFVL